MGPRSRPARPTSSTTSSASAGSGCRATCAVSSEHCPAEPANSGQLLEPGGGVGAERIVGTARTCVALGDLAEPDGWIGRLEVVVLHARDDGGFVDEDVDGAHAEARELGRGRLRVADPDVTGAVVEQVLHAPVAR